MVYLKKVLKSETLPFEELELSKTTKFNQLLITAAKLFGENPKRGRLLIDDTVFHGPKLYMTLDEFGVPVGQLIYAEFTNAQNEWPSDVAKRTQQTEIKREVTPANSKRSTIRTIGLHNLGNTCYLNSALQIVANLKLFHEYFVLTGMYARQSNLKNPQGYSGDLVESFAQLINQMYDENAEVVVPRDFKKVIS
jgi:hypothetical protein